MQGEEKTANAVAVSTTSKPNINIIPQNLRERNQWVVWRYVKKPNTTKPTKPPYNPKTKTNASVSDPYSWGTFEEATNCLKAEPDKWEGLGYVLTANDKSVGIDLDDCRDPSTGFIQPWAAAIIQRLDSYTEISPSGKGIRIFVIAALPENKNTRPIEIYSHAHYLTVTGNLNLPSPTRAALRVNQPGINWLIHNYDTLMLAAHISVGEKGAPVAKLFNGDTTDYHGDASRADLALCGYLRGICERNETKIDALFRLSGLMRRKWDEKHSADGRTYGQMTIDKALETTKEEKEGQNTPKKLRWPEIIYASELTEEKIEWLWKPYFPKKKLVALGGDPGEGKTYVMIALAAHITRGWPFPDTIGANERKQVRAPEKVLFINAEDGQRDTILPRFKTCGGDPTKFAFVENGLDVEPITFERLDILRHLLEKTKPALVVFDPIQAFFTGKVDMYRANETRPVMANMMRLAEEFSTVIVMVQHLTKDSKDRAIYRGLGSIDLAAAFRSMLLVGQDKEGKRSIIQTKISLAAKGMSIGFEINDAGLGWTGVNYTEATDVLRPERVKKIDSAEQFLKDIIGSSGSVPAATILEAGKKAGFSEKTLRRAKTQLPIKAQKTKDGWLWDGTKMD